MRPLPPFTVRPLKREEAPKPSPGAISASVRDAADDIAADMNARAGRVSVKPGIAREKPRLRVLERPQE